MEVFKDIVGGVLYIGGMALASTGPFLGVVGALMSVFRTTRREGHITIKLGFVSFVVGVAMLLAVWGLTELGLRWD